MLEKIKVTARIEVTRSTVFLAVSVWDYLSVNNDG